MEGEVGAVARLDQLKAEMDRELTGIVGRVRTDLENGMDRTTILAKLVVDAVRIYNMPKEGPGVFMFASAVLRLADQIRTIPAPDDDDHEVW